MCGVASSNNRQDKSSHQAFRPGHDSLLAFRFAGFPGLNIPSVVNQN
jgi:hypothetical protein